MDPSSQFAAHAMQHALCVTTTMHGSYTIPITNCHGRHNGACTICHTNQSTTQDPNTLPFPHHTMHSLTMSIPRSSSMSAGLRLVGMTSPPLLCSRYLEHSESLYSQLKKMPQASLHFRGYRSTCVSVHSNQTLSMLSVPHRPGIMHVKCATATSIKSQATGHPSSPRQNILYCGRQNILCCSGTLAASRWCIACHASDLSQARGSGRPNGNSPAT